MFNFSNVAAGALMVLSASVTFQAHAEEAFPEPFGLTWDMTTAELQAVGFSNPIDSGRFQILTSVTAPKPWSSGDEYLAITFKGKLVKAIVISEKITSDLYGSEGKELYSKVKSLLTKKYGAPSSSFERIGLKLYDDADEFYQCLDYDGCGYYYTVYDVSGGNIGISIEGQSRGSGYVKITYEAPAFSASHDAIEAENESDDQEAL